MMPPSFNFQRICSLICQQLKEIFGKHGAPLKPRVSKTPHKHTKVGIIQFYLTCSAGIFQTGFLVVNTCM